MLQTAGCAVDVANITHFSLLAFCDLFQEKEDLCSRLASLEQEHDSLKASFEKELEVRVAQTLAVARDERELESDSIREELDQLYSSKVTLVRKSLILPLLCNLNRLWCFSTLN